MGRRHVWVPWILFALVLGLHLWKLDQPPKFMSDEWYFVQDGERYLTGRLYTDAHPPLGKLQLGMVFTLFGSSPFTWRIGNAAGGALLILVVWWLAWRLTRRPTAAHLAGFFTAVSGTLLTESHSGLINLPYVLYGFVSVAAILGAVQSTRPRRWIIAAATAFGLAMSVKWLAVVFVLPAMGLWFWPRLFGLQRQHNLPQSWVIESAAWLFVWPLIIYLGIFWIHFAWLQAVQNTWQTHLHMLKHHLGPRIGHPYHLTWWGWPLLWQPFPYWSEFQHGKLAVIWSLPNPALWWSGWVMMIYAIWRRLRTSTIRLVVFFALASWAPLIVIQRDMFIYHTFPMVIWLAILVAMMLAEQWAKRRWLVLTITGLIFATWLWFLPWYANISMSETQHQLREWLPSWTFRPTIDDQASR